jgi:hypothetical protein
MTKHQYGIPIPAIEGSLPNSSSVVLAWDSQVGDWFKAHYSSREGTWYGHNRTYPVSMHIVSHWTPLPPPPV